MKRIVIAISMIAPSIALHANDLHDVIAAHAELSYYNAEYSKNGIDSCEHERITKINVETITFILKYEHINVNEYDHTGLTPLMQAAYHHQWELMVPLIKAGANVTLTDKNGNGITALHFAQFRSTDSHPDHATKKSVMARYYTDERRKKCIALLTQHNV